MRNLKKILALALVFAMTFAFTASAATFTDQAEIGANYVDDVNMLVELGVIAGYPDGSFGPAKNITRAEFAKMAYTLKYGSDADGNLFAAQASKFTDVEGNSNVAWAKGYINYCANQNIVSGVGNNKFNPQGNITVAEATKMILVIMGCDPAKEGFTGANWMANVTAKAIDLGVYDGWAGDPSTLATRELVAKLMRNAIFSPVYEYSAITGTGSQKTVLGADNQTLGEKTMGLNSVTGIVVANERYTIETNEKGNPLGDLDNSGAIDNGETNVANRIYATGEDSGESQIYYEWKDTDGDINPGVITIDRALTDDYLGTKVNVFFKADVNSSAERNYKNVEVIGNVLLNSETVVYTVDSKDITIYPDNSSSSRTEIVPYISFMVDGVEKTVKADARYGRFAKNVDLKDETALDTTYSSYEDANGNHIYTARTVLDDMARYAYVSDETIRGNAAAILTRRPAANSDFFQDMGEASLSKYRFVSVDGGNTYAYMFKMVADDENSSNASFGTVTNYSETKGTVTIAGVGTYDIADIVIDGTVATDDTVAYWRENGVLNVAKVELVTGAVENILTDGGVVIGGNTYYSWKNFDYNGYEDLDELYTAQKSAMGANTTYYVYNNVVLDVETGTVAASVENYAVIIRSYYDSNMNAAYVTLGFADNSEGTYEVGKLNVENRQDPYDAANDQPADFAYNGYVGAVVEYKILANGTVDLSGQNFRGLTDANVEQTFNYHKNYVAFAPQNGALANSEAFEGELRVGDDTYYAANEGSVLFVLYGNPQYTNTGAIDVSAEPRPIKAVAYKLTEKAQQPIGAIPNLAMGVESVVADQSPIDFQANGMALSYVFNTSSGANQSIVAAAMTIGEDSTYDTGDAAEGEAIAYIVSSVQKYDVAADEYYAELTIIDENGLNTYTTVNDVKDYSNDPVLDSREGSGKMLNRFRAGTFVEYRLNSEGKIANMTDDRDGLIGYAPTGGEALTVVNVVSERDGRLYFYNTTNDVVPENATTTALKYAKDGYDVITIDDGAYIGSSMLKVSTRTDNLPANIGNAVIHTDNTGEIIRVFYFVENYSR